MKILTSITRLRRVSRDVTADDHPEEIAKALLEELEKPITPGRKLAGLAAPQFGYLLRIIVMKYGVEGICLVNPVITKKKGVQFGEELCESCPGISVVIERPKMITVKGLNPHLEPVKYKFRGFDACVACHEVDHLNGRLIIDYM